MNALRQLARIIDPSLVMGDLGLDPDPWQAEVLTSARRRILLLCSRQAGKSTTTAAKVLHAAIFEPGSLILLLSPSERQSKEIFRKVIRFFRILGSPVEVVSQTKTSLELANGSRIEALPDSEETVRSFSAVRLLVIDEAGMVSDELFNAVSPMLATSGGQIIALSTPKGQRGWYYDAWIGDDPVWHRIKVTAWECPRIPRAFLEEEKRIKTPRDFRQEYECSFEEALGQVFPSDAIADAFNPEFSGFGFEPVLQESSDESHPFG